MTSRSARLEYRVVRVKSGWVVLVAGKSGLRRSTLPKRLKSDALQVVFTEYAQAQENQNLLPELVEALQQFFLGKDVPLRTKLDFEGLTPFTCAVYRALKRVKRGCTVSYKELATLSGSPKAARGVGGAMRRNPFPPLIPCHRVLGANGALTGFSSEGGVELKRQMLAAEGLVMD